MLEINELALKMFCIFLIVYPIRWSYILIQSMQVDFPYFN